jgi:excisionase family DNA binding protein
VPTVIAVPDELAPDQYLTRQQAARLLHVSVSTIDLWVRKGFLRVVRVGPRKRLYFRDEVYARLGIPVPGQPKRRGRPPKVKTA